MVALKKEGTDLAQSLHQSFPNLSAQGEQLGMSLKCRLGLRSSAKGPGFCISNRCPGGAADIAVQGLSRIVQGILNNTALKLIGPLRAEKEPFHLVSLGSCFDQLLEGDQTDC